MKDWSRHLHLRSGPPEPEERDKNFEAVALRILNQFAIDIMNIPNSDDLLWYVAQNVVGKLNFVDCVIYTSDLEETVLTQAAAMGEKNPFGRSIVNPLKIPFGHGITGRVAMTREAIVVEDLFGNEDYISDTKPARSELCVPMIYGNRVVGVIDSEHPEPRAYGKEELDILTTVAAMTSTKLELLEEAERSVRRYHDLVESHHHLTLEINSRKALEAQLFEARKLEAIGRLSGGFAHDFNNMLTVIAGNLELLDEVLSPRSSEVGECLTAAATASKKGASVIRSMLAFSQRAHLAPEVVHLGALIKGTLDWSKQLLPETITIQLQVAEDAWPTKVDQDAAENALLNLIVNARDAMENGGHLTLSTTNITITASDHECKALRLNPGNYTRLSVSDTGSGIPQKQLQQIFDPFFTTKPLGKGTGLGLSTVFGFMQQSHGAVAVESVAGKGSVFHLYFPAA